MLRKVKRAIFPFIIIFSLVPFFVRYNLVFSPNKPKVILHWTHFYEKKYAHVSTLSDDWYGKHCSVGNCIGTVDRSRLGDAAAIVFHLYHEDWAEGDYPVTRSPSQHYVAWINEHATYTPVARRLRNLRGDYFNMSMTYRQDSHIPLPYILTRKLPERKNVSTILQKVKSHPKTSLVAWFVSHCTTNSDRESYVKELQKYIPVDVYGDCGPLNCSKKKEDKHYCYHIVEENYKFYLSFENSICKDYVTEKLSAILKYLYDVIPVTLGGANYSEVAPPHSFINALDFESPRLLADYLILLARNEEEYLKYFEWRAEYQVYEYYENFIC